MRDSSLEAGANTQVNLWSKVGATPQVNLFWSKAGATPQVNLWSKAGANTQVNLRKKRSMRVPKTLGNMHFYF